MGGFLCVLSFTSQELLQIPFKKPVYETGRHLAEGIKVLTGLLSF